MQEIEETVSLPFFLETVDQFTENLQERSDQEIKELSLSISGLQRSIVIEQERRNALRVVEPSSFIAEVRDSPLIHTTLVELREESGSWAIIKTAKTREMAKQLVDERFTEGSPLYSLLKSRIISDNASGLGEERIDKALLTSFQSLFERFAINSTKLGKSYNLENISNESRAEITDYLYNEWVEYMYIAKELDPSFLKFSKLDRYGFHGPQSSWCLPDRAMKPALAYRSLHVLKSLFSEFPDCKPKQVLDNFMRTTITDEEVAQKLKQLADENIAHKQEKLKKVQLRSVQRKDPNNDLEFTGREKEYRRDAESQKDRARELFDKAKVGEIIELENLDQIDEALFLIGAQLLENSKDAHGPSTGNSWRIWHKNKSVVERIKPDKFYGTYKNPRLLIMPVDEEFIGEYFKDTEGLELGSVIRITSLVDLYSTGRGCIGASAIDSIIYLRNNMDPYKRAVVKSLRGRATGDKLAEYLSFESILNGIAISRDFLVRAFPGGLPGLGKRR